ncbi:MAG: PHP domain-containing protein [Candidatus Electrothrix sp. AR4]|nr:PHP domain-containing protein [Candidatus Electrothrix sp. AR4]
MCVELHTHSVYSDGTSTPAELIMMATARNLQGFALTDHDTVEGVQETIRLGAEHGVAVVSGLEVSACHRDHSLHILGYGIDTKNRDLLRWLERLQQGRAERNTKILEKLRGMGVAVSSEEVDRLSTCGQTGRPHIARLLIDKGYVNTMNQAFDRYLGRNKPAWCSRFAYSAAETIAVIHQTGGLAVLAHPGSIDNSMRSQPLIIQELAERKLDGLELFYPSHTHKTKKRLKKLAKQYNLLCTGGSDYHGDNRTNVFAGSAGGICPPDSIMDELLERLRLIC